MTGAHRSLGVVDIRESDEKRIVALYVEHGLTLSDIRKRFGGANDRIKAVLEKHGVKLRNRGRPC